MQPLDPGQRCELEYQLAQAGRSAHVSPLRRVLLATFIAAVYATGLAFLIALAGGPWVLLGLLAFAVCDVLMLVNLFAPRRVVEWSIRMVYPKEESMKRAEHCRNLPG